MYKVEDVLNKLIKKVIRENIQNEENEMQYWDRHWIKYIEHLKMNNIPFEIKSIWWKNLYDEMTNHYEKILNGFDNKEICELGCGSGYSSLLMAQKGAKVTLVDFSHNALNYSKELCSYMKIDIDKVNFIKEDGFRLNKKIGKFDVVWNCGVIEHYEHDAAVNLIEKIASHTKVGGKVMITLPNLLSPQLIYKMIQEGKGSEIFFSHRMLKRYMEESGLTDVEVRGINYWVPSLFPEYWAKKATRYDTCKYIKSLAWLFNGVGTKK